MTSRLRFARLATCSLLLAAAAAVCGQTGGGGDDTHWLAKSNSVQEDPDDTHWGAPRVITGGLDARL